MSAISTAFIKNSVFYLEGLFVDWFLFTREGYMSHSAVGHS